MATPHNTGSGFAIYRLLGPSHHLGEAATWAPKVRGLFAALLIKNNNVVPTDELIDELWGESPPISARTALHVYISKIRKRLSTIHYGPKLCTRGGGYSIEIDPCLIDAHEMSTLHADGLSVFAQDPELGLKHFHSALSLFRGPVLSDLRDGSITGGFARWADEMHLHCKALFGECSLRTGKHRSVVADLARWVEIDPLNEDLCEKLMLALHRSGRRAEALRTFRTVRGILRDELGAEPRSSMSRIHQEILRSE
jgi:SARP family transcriptional regulator, regulator of embCAB operon